MKLYKPQKSMAGIASLVVACACFASPLQAFATDYVGLVNNQLGAKKVGLGATAAQIAPAITAVITSGSVQTSEAGALVRAVLAQMGQINLTGANVNTLANAAIAGLESKASGGFPSTSDLMGLVGEVTALTTSTPFKTTLDAYTAQKNVIVDAAKAGLIPGVAVPTLPLARTPDMGVATALAAFTGTCSSLVVPGDTTTATARRVDILSNIFKSVPAATSPLTSTVFLASARNDAFAAIAGALTGQGALSGSNAGVLVGLLSGAGMADADLRFVAKGAASNLDLAGKQDLAFQAGSQLKTLLPLKETTKQALAIGIASAASSADDRGRIIGQVAKTMANGDFGTTGNTVSGATPVDVRRATLAAKVLVALDYTQAPELVAGMLAVCPLSSDAGNVWNGSLTGVRIASKYTTTLMAAIPAIGKVVGTGTVALNDRSSAVRGATVSIVTPWDNSNPNLSLKVTVAQTVIVASANKLFAPDIARDVAAEVFADSSWSGLDSATLTANKLAFAASLATNISDINKAVVAAGVAASDTSLTGKIVRAVGDLGMGLVGPAHKDPTDLSRAKIASAVALYLSGTTGTIDSGIMTDIAKTGASYASGTSAAVNRANYANQIVLALAKPTSVLANYDAETTVANAIAGGLITSGSASDAETFVGALAKLQKVNGPRIGTLVTAMTQTFNGSSVSIDHLASTIAANAPVNTGTIATIAANYAAQTYGATSAIAVGHSLASTTGVVSANGVPIFTAVANAAAATVSGTADKATQVGLAANAVLSGFVVTSATTYTFQPKAGDIATAAGALSYLNDAGKASVAGAISASLVGSTAATNAANVAANLSLAVGSVAAKGDVTAAVMGNMNGITALNTKAILTKVFPQLADPTTGLTDKQNFTHQIISDLAGTTNGKMFVSTVSGGLASYTTGGIVASQAPDIAKALATGFGEQTQRWIAVGVAESVTAQSSAVAKSVLGLAQSNLLGTYGSNLLPANNPTNNRATLFAQLGARFAYQFATSANTTVKKSTADIAGASATAAAKDLPANNMSEVAHEMGMAFSDGTVANTFSYKDGSTAPLNSAIVISSTLATIAHNNVGQLVNANNSGYATKNNLTGFSAGELSEEFAAIAVALTHNMTKDDGVYLTGVVKALVSIAPHAAPDILGVVLTDLISRSPAGSITSGSPIVGLLNTAATTTAVATNKTDRNNVLAAIFSANNPYTDKYSWGNITGDETPVYNR